jgi:hypothetical protein
MSPVPAFHPREPVILLQKPYAYQSPTSPSGLSNSLKGCFECAFRCHLSTRDRHFFNQNRTGCFTTSGQLVLANGHYLGKHVF